MKVFTKEQLLKTYKLISQYFIIGVALILGYIIGHIAGTISEKTPTQTNNFLNMKSSHDISIAVDEDNKLLIIDKNTGTYQIYSDSVGNEVFKIYSHRLYIQAHE
jgi:hypothetical protein